MVCNKVGIIMVYCDKDPYYTKSQKYFVDHCKPYNIAYWTWMAQEYKCVLLTKAGSFSDLPDEHWAFNNEKDMTFFKLRWS